MSVIFVIILVIVGLFVGFLVGACVFHEPYPNVGDFVLNFKNPDEPPVAIKLHDDINVDDPPSKVIMKLDILK